MGRPSFLSALGWCDVGVMHIMVHEKCQRMQDMINGGWKAKNEWCDLRSGAYMICVPCAGDFKIALPPVSPCACYSLVQS